MSEPTICPVCGAAAMPKDQPDGMGGHLAWTLPERPPERVLTAMTNYMALHRKAPCAHALWAIMREQLAKAEAATFGASPPQGEH